MAQNETGIGAGMVFLSFLAGAVVGSGLALLFTPNTGKELRNKVTSLSGDAMDKIKEFGTEAQDKVKSTFNKGKEIFREKEKGFSTAEAVKEATFH